MRPTVVLITQMIEAGMAMQVVGRLIPSPVAKCPETAGRGKHLLCGKLLNT